MNQLKFNHKETTLFLCLEINITIFHLKGMPSIKYIMLYIKLRQIHHCPCLNPTNSSPPSKLARMG